MMQDMFSNIVCSFFGTIAYAVMYNVPKKYYVGCGFTGMAGWLVYCYIERKEVFSSVVACFFGALAVVLIARTLSVKMKCPITIFLISGIFPLVPGAKVYNTVYYLVMNDRTLASAMGMQAIKIAFAIVVGIVIGVSIPKEIFNPLYWRKRYLAKVERPE